MENRNADGMDALKKFVERKGIRKWFKRDNLIILVLSGVLLMIIALPTKKTSSGKTEQSVKTQQDVSVQKMQGAQGELAKEAAKEYEEYEKQLEERLTNLLNSMEGAGKVSVMITLKSSQELVVEKDRTAARSNTAEEDSKGGTRNTFQSDNKEETVYSTGSGEKEPYVVKVLTPEIEGVVVAVQGAGKGDINKNITEAIEALFGIEAHKIKIIKGSK